jgi:CheY-like chemotaxis protein
VEAVVVLRPEIVLLDIHLPDLDGLAVAERLATIPNAPGRRAHLQPRCRSL